MSLQSKRRMQHVALSVTRWIGSPQSIAVHTAVFAIFVALLLEQVFPFDALLLVFNTVVSLEAIYLALFIQMTVNYQGESLQEVEEDIDEMQEDVSEIQEDIDEIQEDVDEIQEDMGEIQEDVVELQPRLAGMPNAGPAEAADTLEIIRTDLQRLIRDVEKLQAKE